MGAAKSAMECLCRYFAVALAGQKVTVNAISPGWIRGQTIAVDGGSSLMDAALPLEIQQVPKPAAKQPA
jgi:enoyl-[acyl-carrier-protein] reductase (NADH)